MSLRAFAVLTAVAAFGCAVLLAGASAANAPGTRLWTARFNNPTNPADHAHVVATGAGGTHVFVTGDDGGHSTTIAYDASTHAKLWTAASPGSGNAMAVSADGSRVFVTGSIWHGLSNGYDDTTTAYDGATGKTLWTKYYNGHDVSGKSMDDRGTAVGASADGSTVFVTGFSLGYAAGGGAATIAYDAATGAERWVKIFDKAYSGRAPSLAVRGGRVFVTGSGPGAAYGNWEDCLTVAYEASSGDQLWAARYDGAANGSDYGVAIGGNDDGTKVLVAVQSDGGTGHANDYVTIAYNGVTGAKLWIARYNGGAGGDDDPRSLALSNDGTKVFVTGFSAGGQATKNDYLTLGYDTSSGAKLWAARYDGQAHGDDAAYSVAVGGGTVFVTGASAGGATASDVATIAYDASTGATAWTARYDGQAHGGDGGSSVTVTSDATSVYVAGTSYGGASTNDDYVTLGYSAPTGVPLWTARYNGTWDSHDEAQAVALSVDGTKAYVTGNSNLRRGALAGAAAIAYSTGTGAKLWTSMIGGSSYEAGTNAIAASPDGTKVFLAGNAGNCFFLWTLDPATGQLPGGGGICRGNAVALALSHDGTKLFATGTWRGAGTETYYLTTPFGARSIGGHASAIGVSADDSRVFVTGRSPGPNGDDYATIAYDASTGNTLWSMRYDGSGHGADRATGLVVTADGKVVVTGQSYGGSATGSDYLTIAYSAATGAKLWAARYNGPASSVDAASSIALSADGTKAFVAGLSNGGGASGDDYATLAYDTATGAQLWATRYDGSAHGADSARSIATGGGKVFVTGRSYGGPAAGDDFATVAYDESTGAALWTSTYNGPASADDAGNAVAATGDGSRVVVTGASDGGVMTGVDFATLAYQG